MSLFFFKTYRPNLLINLLMCLPIDMADLCTSSGRVCPVSECHSQRNQLVVTGLHGGGDTAQLWDLMDAGHLRATHHGTNLTRGLLCNLFCRL